MKKQPILLCILLILFSVIKSSAQFHPQVPKGRPGEVPLPTPQNLHVLLPDIEITGIEVVGIEERAADHKFYSTIRVTYRNNGQGAMGRSVYLRLFSIFEARAGGTDYTQIGSNCVVRPIPPGESRTDEWLFYKDITLMGRAPLQCFFTIDATNLVAETNEENNRSENFTLTPPRE
jgi:hypothetical protein